MIILLQRLLRELSQLTFESLGNGEIDIAINEIQIQVLKRCNIIAMTIEINMIQVTE